MRGGFRPVAARERPYVACMSDHRLIGADRGERLDELQRHFHAAAPPSTPETSRHRQIPRFATVAVDSSGAYIELWERAEDAFQHLARQLAQPLPASPIACYDLDEGTALPYSIVVAVAGAAGAGVAVASDKQT
jgi:hypothetical protein